MESSHGDAALKEMLDRAKDEDLSDNPRLRNAYALIESRMGKKLRSLVPRFLNTVLGFELDVQALVMDRFFRMWAQETARAKLDGRFEQGGILNLKGERVELKADDPPRSYIAPPPKELHVAPDRGLALGGGGGGGGGAEAAAAAANPPGAMAAGGEEQEKQKLTVVTLTLDRGLSWDNATQFLLEADHMGGRRGGTGFYLHPRLPGPPRPFLAVERAGSWGGNGKAPTFKMLRPDIGREAYIDRTRDELLDMRFLTPEEAEPLWTARYEASVEQCLHGRGRHCKSGLRLRICHILTFNLTQHWQLVKTLFAKKQWRLRVLRAETTTGAVQRSAVHGSDDCFIGGKGDGR